MKLFYSANQTDFHCSRQRAKQNKDYFTRLFIRELDVIFRSRTPWKTPLHNEFSGKISLRRHSTRHWNGTLRSPAQQSRHITTLFPAICPLFGQQTRVMLPGAQPPRAKAPGAKRRGGLISKPVGVCPSRVISVPFAGANPGVRQWGDWLNVSVGFNGRCWIGSVRIESTCLLCPAVDLIKFNWFSYCEYSFIIIFLIGFKQWTRIYECFIFGIEMLTDWNWFLIISKWISS